MAFFDWFSKKNDTVRPTDPQTSGLMHDEPTLPMQQGVHGAPPASQQNHAANRKTERLERRELLYGVVRESMTHVGVLSSSYKFKVLSLDSRGQQFLVMMDLDSHHVQGVGHLAEMESLIAKNAKTRHEILVTSVYWRVIEQVTAGITTGTTATPTIPTIPTVLPENKPQPDSLQEEVAAFKQALASAPKPPSPTGELLRSVRRNPNPPVDFQNTELDDSHSPLSGTQYGELK
jgi:hypothetical protein